MKGLVFLCALGVVTVAGCAPAAPEATVALEAPSPLGPLEAETREALGDLETITVVGAFGQEVAVEVPVEAECATAQCAIFAAASYFSYQDDATQGTLLPQWKALSGTDCYFCKDTIAAGDDARSAGYSVSGGILTLADAPTVFTEDWVKEMPPFSELKRIDGNTVLLSMFLSQSAVVYTPTVGEPLVVEEKGATFLVAMQWNGTYWTVETVAIT